MFEFFVWFQPLFKWFYHLFIGFVSFYVDARFSIFITAQGIHCVFL